MIRVLIVEDSPVARDLLSFLFTSDPEIEVVGTARDGAEALEAVMRLDPDVVTMDIHMPVLDGIEATRWIMEKHPRPVVIVSAGTGSEADLSFQALSAGALAVVLRPPGPGHRDWPALSKELVRTVKMMAEIKVVRRIRRTASSPAVPVRPEAAVADRVRVVAIGASTGGPEVLRRLLSLVPPDVPFPLLVVQHISPGFLDGLVGWLGRASACVVDVGRDGVLALPGRVYFAPDGAHMGVGDDLRIRLSDTAPDHGPRPSVDHLFRSAATAVGARAMGILLTGMGRDGAEGLKEMRDSGALTIAQDEASSVVFGMPREAIRLGGASRILAPDAIAQLLGGRP